MSLNKPSKKQKEEPSTKKEELDILLQTLRDKYGEEAIMRLGEARRVNVASIPSGSFSLDLALGIGGIPRGRIIEIFGPESSGKTTLALHIIAEAQRQGGRAAFIDAEHALDPEYSKRIGVEINDLLISQPNSGEEALNILESLIRSNMIAVAVVDSVAALTPQAEIDGEMGDQHIGRQARLMSQALRKIASIADKSRTTIIFTNQIRERIGIMFGNPETTPGGRALKFYSSVRIDVRRVAQIKKGEDVVGSRTRAKVIKNKVAPPFRIAEFDIIYSEGISYEGDVLNAGIKYEVVKRAGSSYSFGNEKLGVGFENVKAKLKEDKNLLNEIKKKVLEAIKAG